ncbi:hypothetical protein K458DRAFT_91602 [Lentithecium fluviatile CBS 122367]|uniref:F-box domain-containing protein n=1 Tax=Lentithecium fluviatile CBS 122367 TaxID=1168545 RepID=A0A6G1IQN5_9PLEO|nr:hypothetical protein K458DRAFT_91602 [Lentithecium fluviatile CBS 122367]
MAPRILAMSGCPPVRPGKPMHLLLDLPADIALSVFDFLSTAEQWLVALAYPAMVELKPELSVQLDLCAHCCYSPDEVDSLTPTLELLHDQPSLADRIQTIRCRQYHFDQAHSEIRGFICPPPESPKTTAKLQALARRTGLGADPFFMECLRKCQGEAKFALLMATAFKAKDCRYKYDSNEELAHIGAVWQCACSLMRSQNRSLDTFELEAEPGRNYLVGMERFLSAIFTIPSINKLTVRGYEDPDNPEGEWPIVPHRSNVEAISFEDAFECSPAFIPNALNGVTGLKHFDCIVPEEAVETYGGFKLFRLGLRAHKDTLEILRLVLRTTQEITYSEYMRDIRPIGTLVPFTRLKRVEVNPTVLW